MSTLEHISKGLDRFLHAGEASKLVSIPLDRIKPSPFQPRKHFDERKLRELAKAMQEQGEIQPVLVRKVDDPDSETPFELVAGERRLRAAKMAGLSAITAIVREISDSDARSIALMENVHREDLNFYEKAVAITALKDELGTVEEVAKKTGLSPRTVKRYLAVHREISIHPEFVKVFETQAPHIDLTTASEFAALAREIFKLQKSDNREFHRIIKRLNKRGVKACIPWLRRKLGSKASDATAESGEYFRETEKELVLTVRVSKNGLPDWEVEKIRKSIESFLGALDRTTGGSIGTEEDQ